LHFSVSVFNLRHVLEVHERVELVTVWCNGNIVGRINEVTLRRARLALGWVTAYLPAGTLSRYKTSHPGQLSLLCSAEREMSTGESAVMLCG